MRLVIEYIQQFKHFQRNARLFLISNVLSGVTAGILLVLYNLYLISLGYHADFVGVVLFVGTIGAGLAIFPAGACIDRFSGKIILIFSSTLIGIAGAGQILFRQPLPLLISSFIVGVGLAFLLVITAPFLTLNSTPEERPHLFSMNNVRPPRRIRQSSPLQSSPKNTVNEMPVYSRGAPSRSPLPAFLSHTISLTNIFLHSAFFFLVLVYVLTGFGAGLFIPYF